MHFRILKMVATSRFRVHQIRFWPPLVEHTVLLRPLSWFKGTLFLMEKGREERGGKEKEGMVGKGREGRGEGTAPSKANSWIRP